MSDDPVEVVAIYLRDRYGGRKQTLDFWRVDALAALTALREAGFAVVPREATEAMLAAAVPHFEEADSIILMHAARTGGKGLSTVPLPHAYRALLDAGEWKP